MNQYLRSCTGSRWCRIMLFTGLWNLGHRIHPDAVAKSWHAAGCAPDFKPSLPLSLWLRWRAACLLRGCW